MDPIEFELFKNAIFSIADEMALTVFRTTYSGVLKDNMDYSTGFADAEGKLVAQGLTLPGHLGSVPTAMASIMRHYRDDIRPGDVFIMNDPFDGGMHLPDIFVFKPLYHEGERLAFACTVCHHTDVGGRVAGSNASDSTEIYAEGLRIAPLKMYEAGVLNKTLMAFIEKNVRLPVKVFGDLRAQLAACHIAEKQFAELVAKYGAGQTTLYMRETIDYAERLTRAALEKLPDGEWSFEDWIDDDGVDYGKPFMDGEFTGGAWGARQWADGLDGNSHMFADMASHSVEVTETEQPMQFLAYEFVPDKAGAGKYRGGVPFRRDYRFLEEEGVLQVRSDRRTHRPFGLYGGSPGGPSENYLNPDGENRALPSKFTMTIKKGDVFRHVLAGAGGWGDPLERDPAAVLKDVRNELLSVRQAEADYGVVVIENQADMKATAKRRAEIRAARGWREVPAVQREDPLPKTRKAA